MGNYYDAHPNLDDYNRIIKNIPYVDLSIDALLLEDSDKNLGNWIINNDIDTWKDTFKDRLSHVERSLVYLTFYKEQGIKDDTWIIKDRGHVELFPHFKENDWIHKDLFEFYVDACLNKAFASLEILGHVLSKRYEIQVKGNISLYKVLDELKERDIKLFKELDRVTKSNNFRKGKAFRNGYTHNYPQTEVSSFSKINEGRVVIIGGEKYKSTASFGSSNLKYTTSKEAMEVCYDFWNCLMEIVKILNMRKTEGVSSGLTKFTYSSSRKSEV